MIYLFHMDTEYSNYSHIWSPITLNAIINHNLVIP